MKKILIPVLLLVVVSAQAQTNEFLSAADKYFAKGDWFSAATYYEKYLSPGGGKVTGTFNPYALRASSSKAATVNTSTKDEVLYKLAESYRMLHYHEKAEPHYRAVASTAAVKFPLAKFHLGTTLRALGRYDEAASEFNAFITASPAATLFVEDAQRELNNIAFIKAQLAKSDIGLYTVTKAAINDKSGNYAATRTADNNILFTSTREEVAGNTTNNVYRAVYSEGVLGGVTKEALPLPAKMHQGVTALSTDGTTMYLTRWELEGTKKTSALYSSRNTGGKWSEPTPVAALNAAGANTQQPLLFPDGKMIMFASDRAGGLGGFDLWWSSIDENGNFSAPVNLGSAINTKYDEQSPAFHAPSATLVFSSNGRTGMGGYDFFYSKRADDKFTEPKNFGYPVNSVKDDLYFSAGEQKNILEDVLLSSDRDAACCLEIFSLNKQRERKTVSGTVVACDTRQPLANVRVVVRALDGTEVTTLTTDASGRYTFIQDDFRPLKATGTSSGYFTNSISFNAPADEEAITMMNDVLCLTIIPAAPIRVENVYYDYNKATLKEESFPSLDSLVVLLNDNPTMNIELGSHTDSKGTDEYNVKLSDARAKSVVDYLVSKGISSSRLLAKGYGESSPVADNETADGKDNPEGRQLNRRTEFRVLKN